MEDETNCVTDATIISRFDGFNVLYSARHVEFREWSSTQANEWTVQDDNPNGSRH